MATPESKVKAQVSKLLSQYKLYSHMPVVNGYGQPTLDYVGCINGWFFSVETKAPGKHPTPRQRQTMERMRAAGGAVFVIDGDVTALRVWLDAHS